MSGRDSCRSEVAITAMNRVSGSGPRRLRQADAALNQGEPLPRAIGKYEVLSRLGGGAMGVVYKCRQPGLDRPVAVKVLINKEHANTEQLRRFQREAQAAAGLTHPNIVHVYDVGTDGDFSYIVMEYIDGCPLDRLTRLGPMPVEVTLRLVYHVARALQAAHEKGIIHRDIKPANILIQRSGQPKLADFGLAKSVVDHENLSKSGDLIGTPRYMAPEQALTEVEQIDGRADVYSLGAVMYEMLTAQPPADGPNVLAILRKVSDEDPTPVRLLKPEVPEEVAGICHRALQKDREARFQTAAQLADAVQEYLLKAFSRSSANCLELWAALPQPTFVVQKPRSIQKTQVLVAAGAVAILGSAVWGGMNFWGRSPPLHEAPGETPSALASEGESLLSETAFVKPQMKVVSDTSAKLLARARGQWSAGPKASGASPRDRLKPIVEDLTLALKSSDSLEARFLRAQANRAGGEYLAAGEDLDDIRRRKPELLAAAAERMLANYQLHVLYLGNINERALRPLRLTLVLEDTKRLTKEGNAIQRQAARLVEALAKQDYAGGARALDAAPGNRESSPDLAMLEGDVLFHLVEELYAQEQALPEGEQREEKKRIRSTRVEQFVQTLRRGLEADPNHVGLLFLKANSFHGSALAEPNENEAPEVTARRQRLAFESAFHRLRNATLRQGCDTDVARAILLTNLDQHLFALYQVNDALSHRPTVPYLQTIKAWLRLLAPQEGILTQQEVSRILADLEPVFESPPKDFSPYLVRALLEAVIGNWKEARSDLRQCKQKLGADVLPSGNDGYKDWFAKANTTSTVRYLDATLQILWWYHPVPVDLRIRLSETLLQQLADAALFKQEGIPAEEVKGMSAYAHYRLARAYAEKEDRNHLLEQTRLALAPRTPSVSVSSFRDDGLFKPWNADPVFVKLYAEFEKPVSGK
jgi:serine/threonine protein kinase